jgi:uncharacterized phage infection (PIP) family protein YhgE
MTEQNQQQEALRRVDQLSFLLDQFTGSVSHLTDALTQVNEKLDQVSESNILTSSDVEHLKEIINQLNRVVLAGNGQESLLSRVSKLEQYCKQHQDEYSNLKDRTDTHLTQLADNAPNKESKLVSSPTFWAAILAVAGSIIALFSNIGGKLLEVINKLIEALG